MTQPLRTGILVAAIAALTAPILAHASEGYQELSPDQVEKMLGASDVRIFDANTPDLYAKNHVPGAVFVTSKTLAARLPADKDTRLVFYCANTL